VDRDLLRVTFTDAVGAIHVGTMLHAPRVGEYVRLPTGEYRVRRVTYDLRGRGHCQAVTVEVGRGRSEL
jgi:hypothetical protein